MSVVGCLSQGEDRGSADEHAVALCGEDSEITESWGWNGGADGWVGEEGGVDSQPLSDGSDHFALLGKALRRKIAAAGSKIGLEHIADKVHAGVHDDGLLFD